MFSYMWSYFKESKGHPGAPQETRSAAEFLGQTSTKKRARPSPDTGKKPKKRRKAYINRRLKKEVWLKYMGAVFYAQCYACNRELIDVFDCHYGHVTAEHVGGATNVDNLRPICSLCNQASSVRDMREFATSNGFHDARIVQEGRVYPSPVPSAPPYDSVSPSPSSGLRLDQTSCIRFAPS